jgi:hypothetical protein
MAFENPCSLEHMDVVLDLKRFDRGWIAVKSDDNQNIMCAEGVSGYSFAFFEDTEDELTETIKTYTDRTDYVTKEISVLDLLHDWRSIIYKQERQLIVGCKDYMCDTALTSPYGMLYPHAFSLICYLTDTNGKPMFDEWGSLLSAGSPYRLIQHVCAENNKLMLDVFSNKATIQTTPLIYLAKTYKSLLCEGFTCNVPLAISHSYHARNSKNV